VTCGNTGYVPGQAAACPGAGIPKENTPASIKALRDTRLLVFDLDGTLLAKDKSITPRTMESLAACRRRGIMIAFATGRTWKDAAPVLDLLEPDAAALSYGAHVMVRGRTVFRRFMSQSVATGLLCRIRDAARISWQLENGDDRQFSAEDGVTCPVFSLNAGGRVDHVYAWGLPWQTARNAAKDCGCALTQLVGSAWCSFGPRGTGKKPGTALVMRSLSVSRGQAVGFGDESCDIGIFRACGNGVAMGNADEETLRGCGSCDSVQQLRWDRIVPGKIYPVAGRYKLEVYII